MGNTNFDAVVANTFTGNLVGNITGNITGNVTGNLTGVHTGGQILVPTLVTADGAITVTPSYLVITKGSAAALTIAAPTAVTHDGYVIDIYSETAFAHVVTQGTVGFDLKGSSGTLTWAAAKGGHVRIVARNGQWQVHSVRGVTIA